MPFFGTCGTGTEYRALYTLSVALSSIHPSTLSQATEDIFTFVRLKFKFL